MNNTKRTTKILIDANSQKSRYYFDLWAYRDLLIFLAWRDILVRYKQTAIGITWAFARPLLTMIIFSFIFGKVAKLPTNGIPYPLLVFSAMLPWYFFSNAFTDISNSLLANSNMISKVYFPRLVIPLSTIAVSLVDFMISMLLMLGLMIWYGMLPSPRFFAIVFFLILAAATALGMGLWFAVLNVRYRDFRYIVPFITQIGLYISPVGFSSSLVPEAFRFLYFLNPMVAVIEGFRWALLGTTTEIYIPGFLLSIFCVVSLLWSGLWYFRRTENTFADEI